MILTQRRSVVATALLAVVAMLSACSLGPQDLPSPKGGLGPSFSIQLEFASALNLPNGANVTFDGLRVGTVGQVAATDSAVKVSAEISRDADVPSNATATIRQDTVLGDTYVALERVAGSSVTATLSSGSVIPLARTTSPPQLEDTLAVLASFVNGGNIGKIEDTIRKINAAVPDPKDLTKLSSTIAVDLRDLSANLGQIDRLINGLDRTATAVDSRSVKLRAILSRGGVEFWHLISTEFINHIGTLLPSIGSIFEGGGWLVPMLVSVDRTLIAGRKTGVDVIDSTSQIDDFLRNVIVPFSKDPSVDLVSVTTPDGKQLGDMKNILRMLGAIR